MSTPGMRALPVLAMLPWACCGCAAKPSPLRSTEIDSAGVRIVTSSAPLEQWALDSVPELEIGSGQAGGPTEFFRVEGVRFLRQGRFVVANRGTEELRFFKANGEFETAVGRDGRGPEEFRGLSWVAVRGDSVLAYDGGNDRISVWDQFGAFGRSFRLDWVSGLIAPTALLEDGTILSLTVRHMAELEGVGTQLEVGLVSRHDRNGALIDSLDRLPVGERVVQRDGNFQTTVTLPLGARGRFTAKGNGFCYVFGPAFEIRCFGGDGQARSIARIDSAGTRVRPGDVDVAFEHELEAARGAGNEPRVQALLRTRPRMTFPEFFPAFSDLMLDDVGRLWAKRYAPPGQPWVEWWVFLNAQWLSRLRMDSAFEAMDVSGDRVIGVWKDDLGIERVRLYRYHTE